ncbi:MAG: hypothetical protein KGZ87_05560 [Bacteroidetes bacterium]|nr:hypothetical protein [Bacteroidota bacterium]
MVIVGNPITEEQKSIFHRLLTTNDLIDISTKVNVSYSTVRNIFYRTQSITEENKEVVAKMISKSFEKTEDALIYFEKAKSELKQMLQEQE